MRIDSSVIINAPLEKVAAYFADPQYLKDYQEGFLRKELVSGLDGEVGAVSAIYYQYGNDEMEIRETVLSNELPNSFFARYHHKHMDNTMQCNFVALSENQTRYDSVIEYTRINWVVPRLVSILFPNLMRKPPQKWMDNFKKLVEAAN